MKVVLFQAFQIALYSKEWKYSLRKWSSGAAFQDL